MEIGLTRGLSASAPLTLWVRQLFAAGLLVQQRILIAPWASANWVLAAPLSLTVTIKASPDITQCLQEHKSHCLRTTHLPKYLLTMNPLTVL